MRLPCMEEAFEVMGQPDRIVEGGQPPLEDGVLYKDYGGRKGFGYYARRNKGVRIFTVADAVSAVYVTRMQPPPADTQ